ncbi:hypothetical protein PG985_000683 [Apiospora marii]|uniref:Uncharacterized protein n=1 Tax=Apiospora marii TaxID=335849 RepID=A0ABR1R2N9_9PEZI
MPNARARTTRRRAGAVTRGLALERSSHREQERHRRIMRAAQIEPAGPEELEQAPSVLHRAQALANANYPGKRRLTNAYDDRVCKRRNTDSLFGTPWDDGEDDGLEKPAYESLLALSAFNDQQLSSDRSLHHDVEAMGTFGRLPFEIRSEIFKLLLTHWKPINVLKGWSLVYIRDRPNLPVELLRACRGFYKEGLPVLYGGNIFHYKIRDPPRSHRDTNAVIQKVFHESGFSIPIDKHGHLIRNIEVSIEGNRMHSAEIREGVAKALQKFIAGNGLHHPARLDRVVLEVPLQCRGELGMATTQSEGMRDMPSKDFFKRDSRVYQILERLNCQFIDIIGKTSKITPGTRHNRTTILSFPRVEDIYFRAVIDRRPHLVQQSVDAGDEDPWANDVVAITNRRERFVKSRAKFGLVGFWISCMVLDPDWDLIPGNPFERYIPPVYQAPELEFIPTTYRKSKTKKRPTLQEELVFPGPSRPQRYARALAAPPLANVISRNSVTSSSSSSEADIDVDARGYYAPVLSEVSSDDDDDDDHISDPYDAEYQDHV